MKIQVTINSWQYSNGSESLDDPKPGDEKLTITSNLAYKCVCQKDGTWGPPVRVAIDKAIAEQLFRLTQNLMKSDAMLASQAEAEPD